MAEFQKIAKALVSLSSVEAIRINDKISASFNTSKINQKDFQFTFKTKTIWITFIVTLDATLEQRQSQMTEEFEKLTKSNDNKLLTVVYLHNLKDETTAVALSGYFEKK